MEPSDNCLTSLSLLAGMLDGPHREAAWETFVTRYGPLLRGWCARHRLQPADEDEVVAAVLHRLAAGLKTYRRGGADGVQHFRPWLRHVVENVIRDHYRRRRRRPADYGTGDSDALERLAELEARVGTDPGVAALVQAISDYLDDDHVTVFRAVRARQQETRSWRAFEMLCVHEQSVAEVAAALGMTPAAVSTAAYRIKKELEAEYHRRLAGGPS